MWHFLKYQNNFSQNGLQDNINFMFVLQKSSNDDEDIMDDIKTGTWDLQLKLYVRIQVIIW